MALRSTWIELWRDPDRRRALLLSLVVHLGVLLLLAFYLNLPPAVPVETFLVIEVGTPALAELPTEAPAAQDPAPVAPSPQVADPLPGEPQAQTAPDPVTAAPEPSPETLQPDPPQQAEAPTVPEPAPTPVPAEVPAPPAPLAALPQPPTPALPTAETASTALPEVDTPEIEPLPIAETVRIPSPAPTTEVAPAQLVTPTPSVEVTPAQPVPQPQFSAAVAAPEEVPTPAIQAAVAAPQQVPTPAVQAAVVRAQTVPTPEISATVATARPVTPRPQVAVAAVQPIPTPRVAAAVTAPEPSRSAPATLPEAAEGAAEVASVRSEGRPAGGDADRPGQTTTDDAAAATAAGAAASPDGGAASGTPAQPQRTPFSERRERPLAVMIDNANGYPQSGLREAGMIVEMPVEGGVTRLMAVFDRNDPGEVGPVRSARDYFVELAQAMGGVLVHDGGSPGAMAAIARAPLPTLNAYSSGELFSRQGERSAPYNLYSGGAALRQAVNRLELDTARLIQGFVYRPPADTGTAAAATVPYSGIYGSGFRYLPELNLYRWVRNGTPALDAAGEAVLVDAVLIASIAVRPLPNDDAGRLYIPLSGGPATLLLRGRAIEGSWSQDGGVRFADAAGFEIELAPFKTWVAFTPVFERTSVE